MQFGCIVNANGAWWDGMFGQEQATGAGNKLFGVAKVCKGLHDDTDPKLGATLTTI